jgi:membrane dipeptidase
VPAYEAGLTADQAQRARTLLDEGLVISLHDHPVRFPFRMEETPEYNRTGRQHAAYAGLAASGMTVVFDNMMDGTACVTGNAPWRWDDIITDLGMRQADLAHQQQVMTIRTVADIDDAYRTGRIGLVFGLEAATPIENELDRLDVLCRPRACGRLASPTPMPAPWAAGGRASRRQADVRPPGCHPDEPAWPGGRPVALLRQDRADVCRQTSKPVFMTHAGARAVWACRMKPDDVLRAVADTGGVSRDVSGPAQTLSADHPGTASNRSWTASSYCAELVGIEHVAFGPTLVRRPRDAAQDLRPPAQPGAFRGPAFDPSRTSKG